MTDTVWSRLVARAASDPDAVAVLQKRFGVWTSTSISDLVGHAARTADVLAQEGIVAGDVVALLLGPWESRVAIDLALQLSGAVVVGLSGDTPPAVAAHILGDAAPRIAIVQGQGPADRLLELMEAGTVTSIERVYYLDPAGVQDYANPVLAAFPEVAATGPAPGSLDSRVAGLDPRDPVVRSYTSGTWGAPVAVVRTHGHVLAAAEATIGGFDLGPADRVLSFRPLSDPVENGATVFAALVSGAALALPESRTSVRQAMVEIAPTYLHLTQRFLEEIATDVRLRMQAARGLKRQVLRWWYRKLKADDAAGRTPSPSVVSRAMVGRPVLRKLGLDQVRWLLVSGSPGSTETVRFFDALGVDVRPAYSSAEVGGVALAATDRSQASEGVLSALPGVRVRVVDEQLLLAGPSVAPTTAGPALDADGWLRTGDRAEQVADGVVVTGRVADPIPLPGGGTVAAQLIAARLRSSPYIREAVVRHDGGRVIAHLEATPSTLGRWATSHGLRYTTPRSLLSLPEVTDLLRRAVDAGASRVDATVDEVRVLSETLSVQGGTMTATEKVIAHTAIAADVIPSPSSPADAAAMDRTSTQTPTP